MSFTSDSWKKTGGINRTSSHNLVRIPKAIEGSLKIYENTNSSNIIINGTSGVNYLQFPDDTKQYTAAVGGGGSTIDIVDTSANITYYPVFVDSSGLAVTTLNVSETTTPFSINPSTGDLRLANTLKIDQSTNSVAIGNDAGNNTQGDFSVAIGNDAGVVDQGANSVAIGNEAGNVDQGGFSVAIGDGAGNVDQGTGCIAIGNGAGNNTQGGFSVAIGYRAGIVDQSGNSVAIGNEAGNNTQGTNSVAIGYKAGNVDQSGNSVAIGVLAGYSSQGDSAVAIGNNAGLQGQGQYTVAIGVQAGLTDQSGNSVAIGYAAGTTNQGDYSVAIGDGAGNGTQGTGCIAIGNGAGTTNQGDFCVAIGSDAAQLNQPDYSVAIGSGATPIANHEIRLGTVLNTVVIPGPCDALTFNTTSDARYKENICDLENSLEKICSIRGVEYNWTSDENLVKHSGVIAQEVDKFIPEAVNTSNPEKLSVDYNSIIGHLIESVKTLHEKNEFMEKEILQLKNNNKL
jgi:hypothetical protein